MRRAAAVERFVVGDEGTDVDALFGAVQQVLQRRSVEQTPRVAPLI